MEGREGRQWRGEGEGSGGARGKAVEQHHDSRLVELRTRSEREGGGESRLCVGSHGREQALSIVLCDEWDTNPVSQNHTNLSRK